MKVIIYDYNDLKHLYALLLEIDNSNLYFSYEPIENKKVACCDESFVADVCIIAFSAIISTEKNGKYTIQCDSTQQPDSEYIFNIRSSEETFVHDIQLIYCKI